MTEIQFYILAFIITHPFAFMLLVAWSFLAKGAALLRAFERKEKGWFVALLLINTVGILEVFYLYTKRKPKAATHKEVTKVAELIKEGGEITYDDFAKVELKVAKIKEAVRVEKSEKLIKLQLELGEEKRQIVAGIGKAYAPEDLIGKEIITVANLAPKALMGVESHGMLLAAGGGENPVLLTPEKEMESGAKVK
ncbi:methionine--tRNA ligase subunit beta [Candidatus Wolfebacteria bacterium RIFOXYB2_FULL_49_7]|uniref:Methionine--tRNA ligase n=1 Tax=Candidatus Wolfebacteria bacterium RIFOXYB1_FULL_54_12 TaxID=1802559 RepID=A0A1F8DZ75_9BACT|nr:MAG: methionine--tRNA ligase subunit beta [Candidatus Wolfebacteria bacterium RIFOXYB1_FULL_54_12]OGM93517.1 MAG: methionine--tRNA ligase subunit beta [Candidatus Wolfebacteria bacterium RIFOXYB2_FULL_49_7]